MLSRNCATFFCINFTATVQINGLSCVVYLLEQYCNDSVCDLSLYFFFFNNGCCLTVYMHMWINCFFTEISQLCINVCKCYSNCCETHCLYGKSSVEFARPTSSWNRPSRPTRFFVAACNFLGHIVYEPGISMQTEKVQAIGLRDWTLTELRAFLGTCGYITADS